MKRPVCQLLAAPAAFVLILASGAPGALAQCSGELTGVYLVTGIYPGTDVQVQLLCVSRVAPKTYPSDLELLATVQAAYSGDPSAYPSGQQRVAAAGNFYLYEASASDAGVSTIIDWRTGQVVFAGTVWFMGEGHLVTPTVATHPSPITPGAPAGQPASIAYFPSAWWYSIPWGTPEQLTQAALVPAAQTDFLRSMATCEEYSLASFTYTPNVGPIDRTVAVEVLLVSGHADTTWVPLPVGRASWGQVKALHR